MGAYMAYKINLGVWGRVFAVPSCVAETLKITNGDHIKVLLYMLANPDKFLTNEEISEVTGVGTGTVSDALLYWQSIDIIAEEEGVFVPAEGSPIPTASADVRSAAAVKVKLISEPQVKPKIFAEKVNNEQAFKCLCQTFEQLRGRTATHSERNALMTITEETGLPTEVALMLVQYCYDVGQQESTPDKTVNKLTPQYLKKVALDWYENGVVSISAAEERIRQLKESKEAAIAKAAATPSEPVTEGASFDAAMFEQAAYERYRKKR